MIERNPSWGGTVVYGDTDSLFVSLPGKTKYEAFRIGADMAAKVTAANPRPIKLKFEKVRQFVSQASLKEVKFRFCLIRCTSRVCLWLRRDMLASNMRIQMT